VRWKYRRSNKLTLTQHAEVVYRFLNLHHLPHCTVFIAVEQSTLDNFDPRFPQFASVPAVRRAKRLRLPAVGWYFRICGSE